LSNEPVTQGGDWKSSIEDRLLALAKSNSAEFGLVFLKLRKLAPIEVSRACLRYLARNGMNAIGSQMASWLTLESAYLDLLLEPDLLSAEEAATNVSIFARWDRRFAEKWIAKIQPSETSEDSSVLIRSLELVSRSGDVSVLLTWLRRLSAHPDEKVRSRAVKLAFTMRPNPAAVEQQLKSEEPRIRANAVEALWGTGSGEAIRVFSRALADEHHRVAVNAALGLHFAGVPSAWNCLVEFATRPTEAFRAAAIWALHYLLDPRAIPILKKIAARDESNALRISALAALAEFPQDLVAQAEELRPVETKDEQPSPVQEEVSIVPKIYGEVLNTRRLYGGL
jgi:hypothetical protein